MWYHNDLMINYEEAAARRERVRVVTEPDGELTRSRLLIQGATPRHSGNYSCRASNTQPDYVYVFVSTDGDNIAAIQRHNEGAASSGGGPPGLQPLLLSALSALWQCSW